MIAGVAKTAFSQACWQFCNRDLHINTIDHYIHSCSYLDAERARLGYNILQLNDNAYVHLMNLLCTCYTRGEFNNTRAHRALVDWYLSLLVMCKAGCKARHQYNERLKALALLNSPQYFLVMKMMRQVCCLVTSLKGLATECLVYRKYGRT